MNKFLAFLCAALIALPASAQSLADWKHKHKVVIDSSASGTELKEGAAAVPVAIRLHTGNFAFAEAKPDGSDLRVAAADGKTPLRFHIEKYDATNELAVIWVQLPKLAAGVKTDSLLLLWGNDKAVAAGDARGTYDAPQSMVLHFGDSGLPQDASGKGNHARESTAKPSACGP